MEVVHFQAILRLIRHLAPFHLCSYVICGEKWFTKLLSFIDHMRKTTTDHIVLGTVAVKRWVIVLGVSLAALALVVASVSLIICFISLAKDNSAK